MDFPLLLSGSYGLLSSTVRIVIAEGVFHCHARDKPADMLQLLLLGCWP